MKKILFLFLLSLLTIGCIDSKKKNLPDTFSYGSLDENSYTNDFLNLELSWPVDWVVVEGEQLKRIKEAGDKFAAGDNKQLQSIMKASEVNSAQLLSLFHYELGSPVKFNNNLQVIAENLTYYPGISSAEDYLHSTQELLTKTAMDIEIIEDVQVMNIGGKEFKGLTATNTINNLVIYQTYICTVKNGFAINFVISYINDTQKEELFKIIGAMNV